MIETKNGVGAGGLLLAAAGGAVLGFVGAVLLLRDPERVQRWMQRAAKGIDDIQASLAQHRDDLADDWNAASTEARIMTDEEALAAAAAAVPWAAEPVEESIETSKPEKRPGKHARRNPAKVG